jgi:hypothetical protein
VVGPDSQPSPQPPGGCHHPGLSGRTERDVLSCCHWCDPVSGGGGGCPLDFGTADGQIGWVGRLGQGDSVLSMVTGSHSSCGCCFSLGCPGAGLLAEVTSHVPPREVPATGPQAGRTEVGMLSCRAGRSCSTSTALFSCPVAYVTPPALSYPPAGVGRGSQAWTAAKRPALSWVGSASPGTGLQSGSAGFESWPCHLPQCGPGQVTEPARASVSSGRL